MHFIPGCECFQAIGGLLIFWLTEACSACGHAATSSCYASRAFSCWPRSF